MPDLVNGYNANVTTYEFDQQKAKDLLKEAGQENLTSKFAYPTGVSRPYMPTPEDTFQVLKSQLEAVGITITPVSAKWTPDYLDMAQTEAGSKKRDIHLLGWTGDYNDPDNFLGRLLRGEDRRVGLRQQAALRRPRRRPASCRAWTSRSRRTRRSTRRSPSSSRASRWPTRRRRWPSPRTSQGYVASPVQDEVWNNVTVG